MKLLIDIGNTSTKIAVCRPGERGGKGDILYTEHKDATEPWETTFQRLSLQFAIDGCAISCVGADDAGLHRVLATLPYPYVWLENTTTCALHDIPAGYGADRLAADLGAIVLLKEKWPATSVSDLTADGLLIVDVGTCITYDLILDSQIVSGVISPGAQLRLQAMHDYTALLPLIHLDAQYPDCSTTPLLGTDTHTCMLSGVLHGVRFEIEGYIHALRSRYPRLKVCLTGGFFFNVDPDVAEVCIYDPHLVLYGLLSLL